MVKSLNLGLCCVCKVSNATLYVQGFTGSEGCMLMTLCLDEVKTKPEVPDKSL